MANRRSVTLATIAAATGVSVPTVSKVVNGHDDVAPTTRRRVRQALRELQYVPPGGRPPVTATVQLLFDVIGNWYGMEVLGGVHDGAAALGHAVVVGSTPVGLDGTAWARSVRADRHVGLVVVTSRLSQEQVRALAAHEVPLVVIDPVDVVQGVPSVGSTDRAGATEATEHLLALGHRRIGVVSGPQGSVSARERLAGHLAALEHAGVAADDRLLQPGDFRFEAGHAAVQRLLDLDDPPSAVFALSDAQAFGALEAARQRGLRVPDDLSVVGFDDLGVARWAGPPLTTVRQPMHDIGEVAVRRLVRLAEGERPSSLRVELATELVVRHSTAPPP